MAFPRLHARDLALLLVAGFVLVVPNALLALRMLRDQATIGEETAIFSSLGV